MDGYYSIEATYNAWSDKIEYVPGHDGYINATAMFRCRPDIVKNLFVVSSTNNADDDQLYVGMVNMCYATRNLSRYGLPYSN